MKEERINNSEIMLDNVGMTYDGADGKEVHALTSVTLDADHSRPFTAHIGQGAYRRRNTEGSKAQAQVRNGIPERGALRMANGDKEHRASA